MAALAGNVRRNLDCCRFGALRFGRESRRSHIVTLEISRIVAKAHIINRARIACTAKILTTPSTNIVAFFKVDANLVSLGNKAANHELVSVAKLCAGINDHAGVRTPLGHLHDCANLVCATFVKAKRRLSGQIFGISGITRRSSATDSSAGTTAGESTTEISHAAAPVTHTGERAEPAGRRFRTAIGTDHVDRIGGSDVIGVILARKEHNHVALRRHRRIAKNPTARVPGIVTQGDTLQAYRSVARVVKFEPAGVIAVVIFKVRIRGRNFGENHREIADKRHRRIDSNHARVFTRERAFVGIRLRRRRQSRLRI